MKVKNLVLSGVMCALLCVISPLVIPLGPVSLSLSTLVLGIMCCLLGSINSLIITLLYISLGIAGLPVFSGFGGGLAHILGPSGGFILGYIPFSVLVPLMRRTKLGNVGSLVIGYFILYIMGALHYAYVGNICIISSALLVIIPFIIPDILKIILTLLFTNKLEKIFNKF